MTEKLCPSCHRPLPDDAPAGLCPVCALSAAHEPATRRPLPPLEEVQAAFPQFEILACIGHGGMGVVYKVRQRQLSRVLALKVLLPSLHADPGFAVRFEREARTLARLSHPGIVAIYDYGETGDFCWLTMEYVEGVNLRQAMQAARFTPEQALAVIPELCSALQYAHEQGVLHRDIKPENILIDATGKVKIVDFGIARLTGEESTAHTVLTYTGAALGSPAYAAPEQIEQPHRVDHRADLYSLGVVLYEMLTGELPLGRFPAPSRRSGSHPRLDRVIFRTLEKEPDERYQSAEEMRRGLQGAAASEPAHRRRSRRPSLPPYPAPPQPRRPRSFLYRIAPAALICIAILIVFAGYARPALQGLGAITVVVLICCVVGFVLGWLITSLHRLRLARTLRVPPGGALIFFGSVLPAALFSLGASFLLSRLPHLPFTGRGNILVNVAEIFGISLLIGGPFFWLASPARNSGIKPPRSLRWLAAAAVVASLATLAAAKRKDGHLPLANFYGEIDLSQFPQRHRSLYDYMHSGKEGRMVSVRDAAAAATASLAGEFRNRLFLKKDGNGEIGAVGILAATPSEWRNYAYALMTGIDRALPSDLAVVAPTMKDIDDPDAFNVDAWITRSPAFIDTDPQLDLLLLCEAAASALLVAWCATHRLWSPLVILCAGLLLCASLPVWVRPGDAESLLMTGPAPVFPKKVRRDESEPSEAAQTAFDAAWAGDKALFLQFLGKGMKARFSTPEEQDALMKQLSLRSCPFLGEEKQSDGRLRLTMLQRHGKFYHIVMELQDGSWRLEDLQ